MDQIRLEGIRCQCRVGVSSRERSQPQQLRVNLRLWLDLHKAGRSDQLADTVNYHDVVKCVQVLAESQSFRLIECLAEQLCDELLKNAYCRRVQVEVRKWPPALEDCLDFAAVLMTRPATE